MQDHRTFEMTTTDSRCHSGHDLGVRLVQQLESGASRRRLYAVCPATVHDGYVNGTFESAAPVGPRGVEMRVRYHYQFDAAKLCYLHDNSDAVVSSVVAGHKQLEPWKERVTAYLFHRLLIQKCYKIPQHVPMLCLDQTRSLSYAYLFSHS